MQFLELAIKLLLVWVYTHCGVNFLGTVRVQELEICNANADFLICLFSVFQENLLFRKKTVVCSVSLHLDGSFALYNISSLNDTDSLPP